MKKRPTNLRQLKSKIDVAAEEGVADLNKREEQRRLGEARMNRYLQKQTEQVNERKKL